jgi:hypothetical protein
MIIVVAVGAARPAHGQTPRTDRPYRGLFGGGVGNAQQLLSFTFSAGGGYDTNVYAGSFGTGGLGGGLIGDSPIFNANGQRRGSFGVASTGLSYSYGFTRTRFGFSGSAQASANYNTLVDRLTHGEGASVSAYYQVSRKSKLAVSHAETYQPYYSFVPTLALDTGEPLTLPNDNGSILSDYHVSSSTDASFTKTLSRRTSFQMGYTFSHSSSHLGLHDLSTQTATTGLTFGLTKGLSLRTGVRYTDSAFGPAQDRRHFDAYSADVGLDFGHALSLTRRLTLSFGTGTAAVKDGSRTHYFLVGHVVLNQEIGRSWHAGLAYDRSVNFAEFFHAPVVSDSLTPIFSGTIGRRVTMHFGVGGSVSEIGFGPNNNYRNYYGVAGLSYALTRNLALSADYAYSRYRFGPNIDLPIGLSNNLDRHTVRVFLSLWEPLFQRTRRPNASR